MLQKTLQFLLQCHFGEISTNQKKRIRFVKLHFRLFSVILLPLPRTANQVALHVVIMKNTTKSIHSSKL